MGVTLINPHEVTQFKGFTHVHGHGKMRVECHQQTREILITSMDHHGEITLRLSQDLLKHVIAFVKLMEETAFIAPFEKMKPAI